MSEIPPHTAKNVFFSCMDDRLVAAHGQFVEEIGPSFCPTIAGGGLALVDPEQHQIALNQIRAAYKINQVTSVYIESHLDCGAYRLAGYAFENEADETDKLYSDLEVAKAGVFEALAQAGAAPADIDVIVRVVDPTGQLVVKNISKAELVTAKQ